MRTGLHGLGKVELLLRGRRTELALTQVHGAVVRLRMVTLSLVWLSIDIIVEASHINTIVLALVFLNRRQAIITGEERLLHLRRIINLSEVCDALTLDILLPGHPLLLAPLRLILEHGRSKLVFTLSVLQRINLRLQAQLLLPRLRFGIRTCPDLRLDARLRRVMQLRRRRGERRRWRWPQGRRWRW